MLRAAPDQPFVLLDDARPGGAARLYRDPLEIVTARTLAEVRPALERLRAARLDGLHAAGFLAFEAGRGIEPGAFAGDQETGADLLWFGLFAAPGRLSSAELATLLPHPAGAHAAPPRPGIARDDHAAAFARVQALIAAGDIYQANLTFPAEVRIAGDPLALYARLRAQSAAAWGGVVWTGARWLLSLSPELLFMAKGDRLTARPMKGTATRRPDPAADQAAATRLRDDPKQRAENLMIVDLLRNDLARVARAGSVAVPALFTVETYPTIHQLTSTVTAELQPGRDAVDVLAALFPCGSVTGAPKIRATEIIAEVEPGPRGVYTGAIGRLDANGDAAFNVAIRTLVIEADAPHATLGLGSGIVADSQAGEEWAECIAKGAFVTAGQRPFDLFETMRFDAAAGIMDLDRHLARLGASAAALGFAFDRHMIRNELQAATFRLRRDARVKLMLSPSGRVAVAIHALPPAPPGPVVIAIAPLPVAPADFRLRHKTSDRGFYDNARAAAGAFEVVFVDPDGFLTEGSFTSVFVERAGALLTPPLARGLLPGVLRARLLDEGRAREADLTPADLAGGCFIGNALRGIIPAVAAAE